MDATVHWHGLRLENRYDGTHETQQPMAGGRELLRPRHVPRSGAVLVPPAHPRGLRPGDGPVRQRARRAGRPGLLAAGPPRAACSRSTTSCSRTARSRRSAAPRRPTRRWAASATCCWSAARPDLSLTAQLGEVVRLYLTNTANTRVFKVELPGARMKLVGGDSGHVEHEQFVDDVILAPSERVVVDVLFDQAGRARRWSTTRRIGSIRWPRSPSATSAAEPSLEEQFEVLRTNADMAAERERVAPYLEAEPRQDRWRSSPRWTWMRRRETGRSSTPARCTPRSSSEEPGHCPQCGMKLLAVEAPATTYTCPMHPRGRQRASPATARSAA